ncbi:GyrI-like domain-containing protein [uncultured Faecalibaculum sp.]|uniref:GyrI-like domain-containing protein n=1 Tax=uncultured Faecalibaculum sp. TaxID=1729681 RepID=UPI0025DDDD2D|nr:GyrI-like domain-containing protein [uncultured Faecalibaculum sp.]
MAFDYKKEYREYYLPGKKPAVVDIPLMNYAAVRGSGDPNEPEGAYQKAIGQLYAVAYTIKMSRKGSHPISGYFDYVVPPLEGFWWQQGGKAMNYADKAGFQWISLIRLPDFVTRQDFEWAVQEAERKKKTDLSAVKFLSLGEGLCVQCLHTGSYDSEPETIRMLDQFALEQGYEPDFSEMRHHHEVYLSDPRRTAPEKLKTVIRHPVRKREC